MHLTELLTLVPEDGDRFRSVETVGGGTRAFGGQVVAQALVAALHTVPDKRPAHSIHAHFLRAGDSGGDMIFQVERLRDGRSFATRQVTALQAGRKLLIATVSCHTPEEGLEHQYPMPQVPRPEGLLSEQHIREEAIANANIEWLRPLAMGMKVELRPITPRNFVTPEKRAPVQHFWARPTGTVPHEPVMGQAVLTYISDMMLLSTALLPHGIYWSTTAMDSASLDHAVWFHRPPLFDDWMLWSIEAPWTGASRGFARGSFYDRDGHLIASVAQEGLMRLR